MKKAPDAARHSGAAPSERTASRPLLNVEALAAERSCSPGIRVTMGNAPHAEIILSLEQARALSLALIAAVNRQEQHAHTRCKQGRLSVAPQPAER